MIDTRTYDDLGAVLRAMPYESRELTLTLTQIALFELSASWTLAFGGDAGEFADRIVERLAERFDAIVEQKIVDEPSPSRLLEMLNRANAAEAKAHVALEAVRRLVHDHLLGDDVATNQLGKALLAALAIAR